MISITDIEIGIVLCILVVTFTVGLTRRELNLTSKYCGIELQMSTVLKGVACILILLGHYFKKRNPFIETSLFANLVYYTSTNIALALFMYFSGYGLSLKNKTGEGSYLSSWYKRLKKVYIPLLFTCVIAMILYTILPVKYSLEESEVLNIPQDIWYLHHFTPAYLKTLVPHLFGWKDWYVFCIMIFYSFFYLSKSLTRSNPSNQTWVLWILMVAYFIMAYYYFGKLEAHWYRFCWIFFGGHVHGKMVQSGRINKWDLLMLVGLTTTIAVESKYMIISYIIAVVIIAICSLLNRKYIVNSRVLVFMGTISYFFYLSHIRIGYTLMSYINVYSILLWLLITVAISFGLYELKKLISRITLRSKSHSNI